MPTRPTDRGPWSRVLDYPFTILLVLLLGLWEVASVGVLSPGPVLRLVLLPVFLLSYIVDPIGALITRLGLPGAGIVEIGVLVIGAICVDRAMERAAG